MPAPDGPLSTTGLGPAIAVCVRQRERQGERDSDERMTERERWGTTAGGRRTRNGAPAVIVGEVPRTRSVFKKANHALLLMKTVKNGLQRVG